MIPSDASARVGMVFLTATLLFPGFTKVTPAGHGGVITKVGSTSPIVGFSRSTNFRKVISKEFVSS